MSKITEFKGRLWIITDSNGNLVDDIDTDMIYHNAHLAVTEIDEMGQYAFGNLEGWEHFSKEAQPGDMVVVGKNFGSGSSRQHAVDCFAALGVTAILAESYGAIYKRNAINAGFPILTCPDLQELTGKAKNGQAATLDLNAAKVTDAGNGTVLVETEPFSKVQMDIYQAGNIFDFGKTL